MRHLPTHIIKSHQIFAAAHKLLGEEYLTQLWKRSLQSLYRWGADPLTCNDTCHNPVDLLQVTLERLLEIGRDDIVEGALRVLVEPLGYEITRKEVRSDKNSSLRELADVVDALGEVAGNLNKALADGTLDERERGVLTVLANRLIRQAQELKDALERGRS